LRGHIFKIALNKLIKNQPPFPSSYAFVPSQAMATAAVLCTMLHAMVGAATHSLDKSTLRKKADPAVSRSRRNWPVLQAPTDIADKHNCGNSYLTHVHEVDLGSGYGRSFVLSRGALLSYHAEMRVIIKDQFQNKKKKKHHPHHQQQCSVGSKLPHLC